MVEVPENPLTIYKYIVATIDAGKRVSKIRNKVSKQIEILEAFEKASTEERERASAEYTKKLDRAIAEPTKEEPIPEPEIKEESKPAVEPATEVVNPKNPNPKKKQDR